MRAILDKVKSTVPRFNDKLLIDFREREVTNMIQFIADRYIECIRNIDEALYLDHWEIQPPIERLKYELNEKYSSNRVNIKPDEAVLVKFVFKYNDRVMDKYLYIPYIYEDNALNIGGKRCDCMLSVTEKIFSIRVRSNGFTIKLIRIPISFWKNTLYSSQCLVTGENIIGHVVSCKAHYKKPVKSKKRAKPTVMHYLLCKYSVADMLHKFGFDEDDARFITYTDKVDNDYLYFKAQQVASDKQPIMLKVKRESLYNNRLLRDIVASMLYITASSRSVSVDIVDPNMSTSVFRILLGKSVYNTNINSQQAHNYMNKHMESVDEYLDAYTKSILNYYGIHVNNVYELMIYALVNFDMIMLNHPNNNMYNKRVEVVNNAIVDGMIRKLYTNIYKYERKNNAKYMFDQMIKGSLRISPKMVMSKLRNVDNARRNASIYGDNWLLAIGDKVIKRLSASNKPGNDGKSKKKGKSDISAPVNLFHPSMIVVESAIGFSSNPGVNALINPYATIDDIGGYKKTDDVSDMDIMHNFVVK